MIWYAVKWVPSYLLLLEKRAHCEVSQLCARTHSVRGDLVCWHHAQRSQKCSLPTSTLRSFSVKLHKMDFIKCPKVSNSEALPRCDPVRVISGRGQQKAEGRAEGWLAGLEAAPATAFPGGCRQRRHGLPQPSQAPISTSERREVSKTGHGTVTQLAAKFIVDPVVVIRNLFGNQIHLV